MPIKFPCPSCKKGLTARDEQAGKKVVCPACKKPLTIPKPASARQPAAAPAPVVPPEDVEAAAAALLSDAPAGNAAGPATTIDFTCEYCDEAVSLPIEEAGKRAPCPACRRIIKVPDPPKADPSNWRRADKHLPSAAKAPDEPAPEGAWGNLTRTVVSREALEEADAIPETTEPVPLRERVWYWGKIAVAAACVLLLVWYGKGMRAASNVQQSAAEAVAYAGEVTTKNAIGPERVGLLHTLAGAYYVRTNVPYSDAPATGGIGSAKQAKEEFLASLNVLQGLQVQRRLANLSPSAESDAALGDLALEMVELGGDKDQVRDVIRLKWEDCLKYVKSALDAIAAPDAKREAYRAVARRLIARDQNAAAMGLASSAFSGSPGERAGARAIGAMELLDKTGDTAAAAAVCDEILKEFQPPNPPALAAEVVTLAIRVGKPPPAPGKALGDDENFPIGMTEGLARSKGKLPEARKEAQRARTPRVLLRSLVALGSAAGEEGVSDLSAACQLALAGLPDPTRENWELLRLARLASRAGVPAELVEKVPDVITDPILRGRARLELLRLKLERNHGVAGTELADAVDPNPKSPARALAYAELARHNARYDGSYLRTARSWEAPLWAFGTLGALRGLQKDAD
jgi:hypothetical protein